MATIASTTQLDPINVGVKQAADLLGISKHTLDNWRAQGKGPHFVRMGRRVLYPYDDLIAFNDSLKADTGSLSR